MVFLYVPALPIIGLFLIGIAPVCLLGLFDVSRPREIARLSGAGNVTSISRIFNPKGVQNGRTLDAKYTGIQISLHVFL